MRVRCHIGAVVAAIAVAGCASETTEEPVVPIPPESSCQAGEIERPDGTCVLAGLLPDLPCEPGHWLASDGSCIPAGVDTCGDGFAADGDRGCDPVLPSTPCAPGMMAVPGQTACRAIGSCGQPPWGNIPVDADTQYVDGQYPGMDSDGSEQKPWTTISDGVDAAVPFAIVAVAAGTYTEDVRVNANPVRLWGRCASMVELVGLNTQEATVMLFPNGIASELRGVSITGPAFGVALLGAPDVIIEEVRVHDTGGRGIIAQDDFGVTGFTLRSSLIENTNTVAVFSAGSDLTIEDSVIRDTGSAASGSFGYGLDIEQNPSNGNRSTLRLSKSVVERCQDSCVTVLSSDATIADSLVSDARPDDNGWFGTGVVAKPLFFGGSFSTLDVARSVVRGARFTGIGIEDAHAVITDSVVSDSVADASSTNLGRGMDILTTPMAAEPASVTLRTSTVQRNDQSGLVSFGVLTTIERSVLRDTLRDGESRCVEMQASPDFERMSMLDMSASLVERCPEIGVLISSSEATIETTHIRRGSEVATSDGGIALHVQVDPLALIPAHLTLRSSLLSSSATIALLVSGSTADIESVTVADTQPGAPLIGGRGVQVQRGEGGMVSDASLRGVLVESSNVLGLVVVDSHATLEGCLIRDTSATADDLFGDGVAIVSEFSAATASIVDTRVERSARAAMYSFGGALELSDSMLLCQSYDMGAEPLGRFAANLADLGGNRCGCPDPEESCKAESVALTPPTGSAHP